MKPLVPALTILLILSACGPHIQRPNGADERNGNRSSVITLVPKPVRERWFPDEPGVYIRTLPGGIIETVIVEAPRPVK